MEKKIGIFNKEQDQASHLNYDLGISNKFVFSKHNIRKHNHKPWEFKSASTWKPHAYCLAQGGTGARLPSQYYLIVPSVSDLSVWILIYCERGVVLPDLFQNRLWVSYKEGIPGTRI